MPQVGSVVGLARYEKAMPWLSNVPRWHSQTGALADIHSRERLDDSVDGVRLFVDQQLSRLGEGRQIWTPLRGDPRNAVESVKGDVVEPTRARLVRWIRLA